jgi:hypothetical protein
MDNKESGRTRIYRHTDAPMMIGNWQMPQLLILISGIYISFMLARGFIQTCGAMACSVGIAWIIGKYRDQSVRGKIRQLMYSHGIRKTKKLIPSDVRYFVGG